MAFAGIWRKNNSFPSSDSLSKYSCCILTKQATNVASEVHHRMPLILDPIHWSSWLGDKMVDKSDLMQIIKNGFYDDLYSIPVSTRVNSAANDDIHCLSWRYWNPWQNRFVNDTDVPDTSLFHDSGFLHLFQ